MVVTGEERDKRTDSLDSLESGHKTDDSLELRHDSQDSLEIIHDSLGTTQKHFN